MRKEEILDRYRREGTDEGREQVNRRGDDAGFYALLGLALPLMLYQVFRALPFGDLSAVLFAFGAAGIFSRYHSTKDRRCLGFGIFNALACLLSLGWYLWLTL